VNDPTPKDTIMPMPEHEKLTEGNPSTYAFLGWVWTCTTHPHWRPDKPAFPYLAALGDLFGEWRFDIALRTGWELLDDECRGWAEEHLLPKCDDFIRGCLLGEIRSR
jgi:hypothetical protein